MQREASLPNSLCLTLRGLQGSLRPHSELQPRSDTGPRPPHMAIAKAAGDRIVGAGELSLRKLWRLRPGKSQRSCRTRVGSDGDAQKHSTLVIRGITTQSYYSSRVAGKTCCSGATADCFWLSLFTFLSPSAKFLGQSSVCM